MLHNLIGIPASFDDFFQDRQCFGTETEVDFFGLDAHDGFYPGVSPGRVLHKLCFVNDSNIIMGFKIQHFYGSGIDAAARLINLFFPGKERTGNVVFIHAIIDFQCKKT